jgi:hypothetical protein
MRTGRPMTAEVLECVLRRYPGDAWFQRRRRAVNRAPILLKAP